MYKKNDDIKEFLINSAIDFAGKLLKIALKNYFKD